MLDSPVSGGPSGAASGRMAIWVGGDEQIFNRHKPVLDAMGDQAAYIGPIGAGSIAKLVHNCTSAVLGVALAEVFTMGVKAGVDPVDLWEAVRQGATGRVRTFDRLGQRFLTGQRALELQASAHTLDSVGYGGPMVTSKILPHRRNPVPIAQMGPG